VKDGGTARGRAGLEAKRRCIFAVALPAGAGPGAPARGRPAPRTRKVLGSLKMCTLAHAFRREYSGNGLVAGPTSGPTWRPSHSGGEVKSFARAPVYFR
jgi:hypothetical protein